MPYSKASNLPHLTQTGRLKRLTELLKPLTLTERLKPLTKKQQCDASNALFFYMEAGEFYRYAQRFERMVPLLDEPGWEDWTEKDISELASDITEISKRMTWVTRRLVDDSGDRYLAHSDEPSTVVLNTDSFELMFV